MSTRTHPRTFPARIATRSLAAIAIALAVPALAAPALAGDPRHGSHHSSQSSLMPAAAIEATTRGVEHAVAGLGPQPPYIPVDAKVDYGTIINAFGDARGRPHEGQDMFAPEGTPVIAPDDTVVLDFGSDSGRGNWASLYDPKRKLTYNYFHMEAPADVSPGDLLKAGDRVGLLGCTGSCWGAHLHFEVRPGRDPYGTAIDPMPLLTGWAYKPH